LGGAGEWRWDDEILKKLPGRRDGQKNMKKDVLPLRSSKEKESSAAVWKYQTEADVEAGELRAGSTLRG